MGRTVIQLDLRPQRRWLPVASRIVPVWVCAGAYNGADGGLSTFFRRFLRAVLVARGSIVDQPLEVNLSLDLLHRLCDLSLAVAFPEMNAFVANVKEQMKNK
jgi:hypothetical protein